MVSSLRRFAFSMINENAGGCKGEAQTPPSSLRDATAPSRGGFGKEGKLYAMPRAPLLVGAVAARRLGGSAGSCCWSQTPPSSLRDATAPSRGGLGKKAGFYAMPRAPLLVGAVAAGDWGVQPAAAAGVKPHRHPYGMPPPLIGAALAKRIGFTPCQGPHY